MNHSPGNLGNLYGSRISNIKENNKFIKQNKACRLQMGQSLEEEPDLQGLCKVQQGQSQSTLEAGQLLHKVAAMREKACLLNPIK